MCFRSVLRAGVVSASLLSCYAPATAALYRCAGPDGVPVFQDLACREPGGRQIEPAPVNALGDPLRAGERALLREWVGRERPVAGRGGQTPGAAAPPGRGERCLRERQRLDAVAARLRRGYPAGQGERLRRRRDAHAEYLRAFCD